ncbi:MAG: hypothetical protein AB1807_11855 [Pseudomonadota bacterium]
MEVTNESAPTIWLLFMVIVSAVWGVWLHQPKRTHQAAKVSLAAVVAIAVISMVVIVAVAK